EIGSSDLGLVRVAAMLAEQPELEHSCSQIASFHVHIYHVLTHIETCRAYLLIELLQLRVTLDVVGDCARAAAEHLAGLRASTAGRNHHLCNLFHRKIGLLDGWLIFLASLHFGEFWHHWWHHLPSFFLLLGSLFV